MTHVQSASAALSPSPYYLTVHNSVLSIRVYYSSGPSGVGLVWPFLQLISSQECKTQAETVSGSGDPAGPRYV